MNRWLLRIVALLAGLTLTVGGLYIQSLVTLRDHDLQLASLERSLQSARAGQVRSAGPATGPVAQADPEVIAAVARTVVRLEADGRVFAAEGSGFLVRADGYVLTNQHVVVNASSITVTLATDEQFKAQVAASDKGHDLALLKLTTSRRDFPCITLGTADDLAVGTAVLAVGFPLGADLPGPVSFTQGIISALREVDGQRYVQTDASIASGSSGGPLVDMAGRVLGVCTAAVVSGEEQGASIGLAVPVDEVAAFLARNLGR